MDEKKLYGLNSGKRLTLMESRVLNMAPRGEKLDVAGEKVEAVISESELGTFLDKLAADEQWKKYLEGKIMILKG